MAFGVGILVADIGHVADEPLEATGELAGQLEGQLRIAGEEGPGIPDDPHGRGDRGQDCRGSRLAQEGADLADEGPGDGELVDHGAVEFDP